MPTINRIPKKVSGSQFQNDTFYQSKIWKQLRKSHYSFADNVLCFYCKLSGKIRLGGILDHFRPRRLFPELQYAEHNLKSACKECDAKKRQWEGTIATKEQFEANISQFMKETFEKI